MLQEKPEYRPQIVDVAGHPWVRNLNCEFGQELTAQDVAMEMSRRLENIKSRSFASEEEVRINQQQFASMSTNHTLASSKMRRMWGTKVYLAPNEELTNEEDAEIVRL